LRTCQIPWKFGLPSAVLGIEPADEAAGWGRAHDSVAKERARKNAAVAAENREGIRHCRMRGQIF
jgi:hypothetical protein